MLRPYRSRSSSFSSRQVEHLAGVAENQVVGLLLAPVELLEAAGSPGMALPSVSSVVEQLAAARAGARRRCPGDDALDRERLLVGIAAGGERLVALSQEARLGEPALRLGQHDVGRDQPLVAVVVALEQRDHGARRRDRPAGPGLRPVCTM